MKINNIIRQVAVLLAFIVITQSGNAQVLRCGNGKIDTAAINQVVQLEKANQGQRQQVVNHLIRVYFHIVRNSDGTNAAMTVAQMQAEFDTLLATYAPNNICFLNAGFDFIDNTNLNMNFNADNDPDGNAFNNFKVPGCIDMFYLRRINGNNTACNPPCGYGGIALGGIPGTFFLVATGNVGSAQTISHEMGHSLGLLHTFESYQGLENINGTNSTTAGDKVADTPADPFAYNGNACYSTNASGCVYTGNCTDPNGASNFSPPYTNLMSYWTGGCYPNIVVSNGQFSRVNSFLGFSIQLSLNTSPANVTQDAVTVSSGYFMQSAINNLSTNGNVVLNGSVKSTFGAGVVLLKPGFQAVPNSAGLIQVKTKPCE